MGVHTIFSITFINNWVSRLDHCLGIAQFGLHLVDCPIAGPSNTKELWLRTWDKGLDFFFFFVGTNIFEHLFISLSVWVAYTLNKLSFCGWTVLRALGKEPWMPTLLGLQTYLGQRGFCNMIYFNYLWNVVNSLIMWHESKQIFMYQWIKISIKSICTD